MKQVATVLFFVATIAAGDQSSVRGQSPEQETQARAYWSDPSTGLMWTAKDNGRNITWGNAVKYCQSLSLAGYSDWSLPSIDKLQGFTTVLVSPPHTPRARRLFSRGSQKEG